MARRSLKAKAPRGKRWRLRYLRRMRCTEPAGLIDPDLQSEWRGAHGERFTLSFAMLRGRDRKLIPQFSVLQWHADSDDRSMRRIDGVMTIALDAAGEPIIGASGKPQPTFPFLPFRDRGAAVAWIMDQLREASG